MKALVTAEFPAEGLRELRSLGYEPVHAGWGVSGRVLSQAELIAALEGAELLICELEQVDEPVFSAVPSLRVVGSCRSDPTNVDLDAAARREVVVLRTPGRNAVSVADFTMGLLLMHARRMDRAQAQLRADGWLVEGRLPYLHFRGPELEGRNLGLLGLGAVGRLVARRAAGFGMRIMGHDPYLGEALPDVPLVPLDELLEAADVLSIHCPLTPETRGLIGRRELGLLGPGGHLVNTARAAVVDEGALLDALRQGTIAGAALDVFWSEPLAVDHPILTLDNVTLTPHVAGASQDVPRHHARTLLDDLARWRRGGMPVHAAVPPAGPAV